jgi:hypothetical protein
MILGNSDKYLKKIYNEIGVITSIKKEVSAPGSGTYIIIECKNHNVKDGEIIYIKDSNSYPSVNNVYSKSVEVVDKDRIRLHLKDVEILKEGTHGILSSYGKLQFDLYEIDQNIDIKFKETTYKDKKEHFSHNKMYLFDKITVNKKIYESMIKKIIPSIHDILENEKDEINKSYTFYDVNKILSKYNIQIDTLHIDDISLLKTILENNLQKVIVKYDKEKSDRLKINLINRSNNRRFLKNNSYFLSDKYIEDKNIEKIYGKYRYLGKYEDNILLRLKWIESQRDHGYLYYLYHALNNYNKSDNKKYIQTKINELQTMYNELEDAFKKEKSLMNKKNKSYKNFQYSKDEDNNEILKKILEKNISLDSLDCIYQKEKGCNSKVYLRLEEFIKKVGDDLENFKKLEKYIKNNQLIKDIESQIDSLKNKFFRTKISKIILDQKNNIQEDKIDAGEDTPKDKLSVLVNLIYSIKEYDKRLNYIYDLIEKDGIVIHNSIYSKKYNKKIDICSHYIYFKKINYADSPNEKVKLIDDMINIYSDNGESEKNVHTCKYCGTVLMNNDYDETEGFSDSGMIKKSREVWAVEKLEKASENIDLLEELKVSDLEDDRFKEILLNYGISIDDIQLAIYISTFVVKNLYSKSGVKLSNISLINIVIDSMQQIKKIIPFREYRNKIIKEHEDKGYSKIEIEKIESKNIFKDGYEKYINIKRSSIISARFLISVQTNIPTLIRSSKSTICAFYSFDGEEGLNYMACILDEMKIVLLKDKTKSLEVLKIKLKDEYNEFITYLPIKELFKAKKIYDIEISKKKSDYLFKNQIEEEKEEKFLDITKYGKTDDISKYKYSKNLLINRFRLQIINFDGSMNFIYFCIKITN